MAASPADKLQLDASQIEPMFTTLVAIDLAAVVKVATLQNLDIVNARQEVVASEGVLESTVGAVFPAVVPAALFEHVEGTVRATEGNLVGVGFNTFQASAAIQWVINPGRVIHDIIAAKKRLSASDYSEKAVVLEVLRRSIEEYYDLVLAQARVATAYQGAEESRELRRINRLRTQTGVGVKADELRAEAQLAMRQQDLLLALRDFYASSVALCRTLHLDASVTMVPKLDELPPIHLVRADIDIEELLRIAVTFRPDLASVRELVEAVAADKDSTWWGAFGPQFRASYEYGGITAHSNDVVQPPAGPATAFLRPGRDDQTYSFSDQQRGRASAGWRFSLSAFGDLKTAGAMKEQAYLRFMRKMDDVRAEVILATQASRTNRELIGLSRQQVKAAAEALRLTEANLEAGTMTTLDVLQSQDAVTRARLRNAEAVVRYNQSQVNLLAALGLLDEASIGVEGGPAKSASAGQ